MADVLAVAIRDVDWAIAFAPECPEPNSLVAIGSGEEVELVVILKNQFSIAVADNIIRGVRGTSPRHWPAGTPWRYKYKASDGESYILRQHRH